MKIAIVVLVPKKYHNKNIVHDKINKNLKIRTIIKAVNL